MLRGSHDGDQAQKTKTAARPARIEPVPVSLVAAFAPREIVAAAGAAAAVVEATRERSVVEAIDADDMVVTDDELVVLVVLEVVLVDVLLEVDDVLVELEDEVDLLPVLWACPDELLFEDEEAPCVDLALLAAEVTTAAEPPPIPTVAAPWQFEDLPAFAAGGAGVEPSPSTDNQSRPGQDRKSAPCWYVDILPFTL